MNINGSTIDMNPLTTSKNKILLIRNANSFDFGGAERFIVSLSKELSLNNWDPIIVTAHKGITAHALEEHQTVYRGKWWRFQDWSGIRILLIPLYLLWQIYLTCWYIALIVRLKPVAVHPQSRDDFISATIAARLTGRRTIWTDHADLKYIYQNVTNRIKNPVGKLVRLCSQYAHSITLVSKSEADLIITRLGHCSLPGNYKVIHNGITDQNIEAAPRSLMDIDAFVFCSTSRLVTTKGISELIESFIRIDKPKLRLWILGEGPEEEKFKKIAAENSHIRFIGFPSDSLNILKSADVFVHPSYHEGFSISILEAAMLGKAIIACKTGGNTEIVQDRKTGLLVPVKNTQALASAMQQLVDDDELRQQVARNARSVYLESFQFNRIVKEEFIPLYEGK